MVYGLYAGETDEESGLRGQGARVLRTIDAAASAWVGQVVKESSREGMAREPAMVLLQLLAV